MASKLTAQKPDEPSPVSHIPDDRGLLLSEVPPPEPEGPEARAMSGYRNPSGVSVASFSSSVSRY
jgi:hypothetical protein